MPRNVVVTTVSLPKAMAQELRYLCREERRSLSELVREGLRLYQHRQLLMNERQLSWPALKARLRKTTPKGKALDLAKFIARDRLTH